MNQHQSYSLVNRHNKFIINADDFGKDLNLNLAILKSFSSGLISSTSLLTNMEGFEDAIEKAHANKYVKENTGIHINLTEGSPLSDPIKSCRKFCNAQGFFVYNRRQPLFFLTGKEQKAIYIEMKAQIERAIEAGIKPSHIDSHHHIHTEWAIAKTLLLLLKEFNLNKMRRSRNLGDENIYIKKIYKGGFNYYMENIAGLAFTNYFGSVNDLTASNFSVDNRGKLVEIMVHPMFNDKGDLVDDDQVNLSYKLEPIIHNTTIISPNEY